MRIMEIDFDVNPTHTGHKTTRDLTTPMRSLPREWYLALTSAFSLCFTPISASNPHAFFLRFHCN